MTAFADFVAARLVEFGRIDAERRRVLDGLATTIAAELRQHGAVDLVFVCTHNSRRSHLGQVWALVAADHFGLAGVRTWSGGTEVTAFEPRAAAALARAGLDVRREDGGDAEVDVDNPIWQVRHRDGGPASRCWSKRFSDPPNPHSGFVALLMCSGAAAACPTVAGAATRVAIPYPDPKDADGLPAERAAYDGAVADIAREMLFLLGRVAGSVGGQPPVRQQT